MLLISIFYTTSSASALLLIPLIHCCRRLPPPIHRRLASCCLHVSTHDKCCLARPLPMAHSWSFSTPASSVPPLHSPSLSAPPDTHLIAGTSALILKVQPRSLSSVSNLRLYACPPPSFDKIGLERVRKLLKGPPPTSSPARDTHLLAAPH